MSRDSADHLASWSLAESEMSEYPNLALYIDGRWCQSSSVETALVINPATEEVIRHLPISTPVDLDRAVAAAASAFRDWADRTPAARLMVMRAAADLIRKRVDPIAAVMTREQGKDVETPGEKSCSQPRTLSILPKKREGSRPVWYLRRFPPFDIRPWKRFQWVQ